MMKQFPIMQMREGDAVTVTTEWKTCEGNINWWDSNGWRVSVTLKDGAVEVFEAYGPRAAKFWR